MFLCTSNAFSGSGDGKGSGHGPGSGYGSGSRYPNNNQNTMNSFRFWRLASLSGEIRAKGLYREQERTENGFGDRQFGQYLTGGVLLKTKSYFVHPNFLVFDADGGYFPEKNIDNYIVLPDQAEVRTLKKLDLKATFFGQKKANFTAFANFDESYQNRENLTDIKSNSKQWGGIFNYNNKILPFSANFHQRYWKQKEISTGRKFTMDELGALVKATKSFTLRDKHELSFSHNEYVNINENLNRIQNTIENLSLHNYVAFGEKKKYTFNSMVSNYTMKGNTDYSRFQALENLTLKLPENLTFINSYNFYQTKQVSNKLVQHNIQSSLDHKLFQSLESRLFFEYNLFDHNLYNEFTSKAGIYLKYTKQIPTGNFTLSYMYYRYHDDMNSDPSTLQIRGEEYTLSDNQIVLLKRAYVDPNTIVVKDVTGVITYVKDVDYILIERYPYIEIRRIIPGFQLANNANVYIDYDAIQPGKYKYDADNHMLSANLMLFNRKLELYYRLSNQDYVNMTKTEYLTLNYFTSNTVGGRLDFEFVNGGAEYEFYNSSLVPYRMTKYFINFQKNIKNKVSLSLGGNYQDYHMIHENENQQFLDINSRISYSILRTTKFNLDCSYRKQQGRGIELELLTSRAEITSVIRQLYLTLGAEFYKRNYIAEKLMLKGVYVQIVRKF